MTCRSCLHIVAFLQDSVDNNCISFDVNRLDISMNISRPKVKLPIFK